MAAQETEVSFKDFGSSGSGMLATKSLLQGMRPSERPLLPEPIGAAKIPPQESCPGSPDGSPSVRAQRKSERISFAETDRVAPSFDQLLQSLALQQESIRLQQQHLTEMSMNLDAVMRGRGSPCLTTPPWCARKVSNDEPKERSDASPRNTSLMSGSTVSTPQLSPLPRAASRLRLVAQQRPQQVGAPPQRTNSFEMSTASPANRARDVALPIGIQQPTSPSMQQAYSVRSVDMPPDAGLATFATERTDLPGVSIQLTGRHSKMRGSGSVGKSSKASSSLMQEPALSEPRPFSTDAGWLHKEENHHVQDADVIAVVLALGLGDDDNLRKMAARLKSRLGVAGKDSEVTALRLHKTLTRLGARRYSLSDCEVMLRAVGRESVLRMHDNSETSSDPSEAEVFSFKNFATVLLMPVDKLAPKFKDEGMLDMVLTVREILLSGDANRLVAELTQVHVDDLAKPYHVDRLAEWMEPIVSIVIILNGITIGWQANETPHGHNSEMWFWVDGAYTIFFMMELFLKIYARGFRWFIRGHDVCWNMFDCLLVLLGVLDMIITACWEAQEGTAIFSVIRIIRLTRLARLFRVFRMKHMKELSLMLVGVIAGMRTLLWAMILLFSAVYILGVFATLSLGGKAPSLMQSDVYANVPMSMFTVFRCLMGDCIDEQGRPIVFLYAEEFGVPFVLGYISSTTVIVFGVFNLIFAIYIESTLAAAKSQRKMDPHESVRVARLTRELLKKFAMAQSLLSQHDPESQAAYCDTKEFRLKMRRGSHGMEINSAGELGISRDLFKLVLKDPEVQILLDSLDISSDRTHLFDILDADGSGEIEASELISGLLRVRGEAKKSDVVANLLAVRAAQNMIRKLEKQQQDFHVLTLEAIEAEEACGRPLNFEVAAS